MLVSAPRSVNPGTTPGKLVKHQLFKAVGDGVCITTSPTGERLTASQHFVEKRFTSCYKVLKVRSFNHSPPPAINDLHDDLLLTK